MKKENMIDCLRILMISMLCIGAYIETGVCNTLALVLIFAGLERTWINFQRVKEGFKRVKESLKNN